MQFACLGAAVVAVIVAPFVAAHLPRRFLGDGELIQQLIGSAFRLPSTSSFSGVASFYRVLGLGHNEELVALATVALYVAVLFSVTGLERIYRFGVVGLVAFMFSLACGVVYLGQYSKESVSLILILLLVLNPRSRITEVAFIAGCIAYGAFIRPYWFIVLVFYLLWRMTLLRVRHVLTIILMIIVIYALFDIAYMQYSGHDLASIRQELNEYRNGVDTGSLIVPPLPLSGMFVGPAAFVMMLCLMVPIPLILDGGIFHLASGVLISFLWVCVVAGALKMRRAGPGSTRADSGLASRALPLLLAFVMVQAVFEPDYGSYLKHLTPLLPLVLTVIPLRDVVSPTGRVPIASTEQAGDTSA